MCNFRWIPLTEANENDDLTVIHCVISCDALDIDVMEKEKSCELNKADADEIFLSQLIHRLQGDITDHIPICSFCEELIKDTLGRPLG